MFVNEQELAVLQAITDNISAVGQYVRKAKVLNHLRHQPRTDELFHGIVGDELFENLLEELKSQQFVETHNKNGEALLRITGDAVKVFNLNTSDLF